MLDWSTLAIFEKNRLASDAPFLLLLKLESEHLTEPVYLARNTEDVVWAGQTWQRYPFNISTYTADGKSMPTVDLTVSNASGLLQAYLQEYGGLTDAEVTLYVVHANLLDNLAPLMELDFVVTATSYDETWITFTLGASPELYNSFPRSKYMANYCWYQFKSVRCGYTGSEPACNNTYAQCRIKHRFGGELGMNGNNV